MPKRSKDLRSLLDAALPPDTEWASLRRVRSSEHDYQAKEGKFNSARLSLGDGYMLEVLCAGQFGYAATGSAEPDDLRAAAERASALARSASRLSLFSFGTGVRPSTVLHYETPRRLSADLDAGLLSSRVAGLSQAMRLSDKIVQALAELRLREIVTEYVSTSGAAIEQRLFLVGHSALVVARDGTQTQRRSLNGLSGRVNQGGYELIDQAACEDEARRIAEEALALLAAEDCPSMKADLVLAPEQMTIQIHESVGHPLELDRILGDERNYAGSSFVRLGDIGKLRYGSELMNVTFDPTIAGEAAAYGADDIGAPARKEYLIKDGLLVRALGSLESQARSACPGVACQRAQDWFRAPIDRMANLNHEPGSDSLGDIVGSIEKGVYMSTNRSWSIDDVRDKFQFGCEYGRLIEDGRLTRLVRNPNYRGVSASFWQSLFKVGDQSTFGVNGTPHCGKGEPNQEVTTGHACPTCAFHDVEIFGGEP